jgi:hypothetical protein
VTSCVTAVAAADGARVSRRSALVELALAVVLPWALDRLRARARARGWAEAAAGSARRAAWRALHACEGAAKALQLAGTLALLGGRRPYALRHVLSGARVGYARAGAAAFPLAFEFVGQQILWQALAEQAALAAELAPSRAAARALGRRCARGARELASAARGALGGGAGGAASAAAGAAPGDLRCVECGASPAAIPCRALARAPPPPVARAPTEAAAAIAAVADPCGHVHCYACLSAALAVDARHECRACARGVRALERCAWQRAGERRP